MPYRFWGLLDSCLAAKVEANTLYKERLADVQANTKMAQRRAERKTATDEYNLTLSEIKAEYKEGLKQVKPTFLYYFTFIVIVGALLAMVLSPSAPPTPEQKSAVTVDPVVAETPKEPVAQQVMTKPAPVSLRSKISDDVFVKYTKKQYPKTFAKYGSRMKDVEKARIAAAFLAASSPKCDKVYASEYSDNGTRDNIQVFTDCANNERFRFEESELKDQKGQFVTEKTFHGGDVKTQAERAFSQEAALSMCRESVKTSAKFPSSVDFSMLGEVVNTSQGSGETWVELDFEAKNDLGLLLPYKANCGFPIHGKPTVKITER